jgi:septal ring factor EnvC (AmiA/AmiB activator)
VSSRCIRHSVKRSGWRFPFVSGFLAAFLILCVSATFSQSSAERDKLQKTKKQLEEEIRYTTEILEQTQKNKQTSLNRLQILNRQIRSREALIDAINRELNQVQTNIAVENCQIDQMSKELAALKSDYARMIYHAYRMMNGQSKLMFIFSAKDFNQGYRRLKYYQQYASFRRRQAERILSTQSAINSKRKELEDTKNQKLALIENQQKEKQKLDREKLEKAKAVKELGTREKKLLSTLRTKQQAAQKLENEIEKLISEEIRASEARTHKTEEKDDKTRTSGKPVTRTTLELTPKEQELSNSFAANRGKLPWPCDRGVISGTFGEHPHPVLSHVKVKNNGVDIMTEDGAVVKSVFKGKVSRVLSFPNLNKVVILRHGDYLTVYSNLSEVAVKDGQEVTTRQTIGRVYINPEDQKSELHFEIWRGKVIQNPEDWIARRY